jgi:hypothetical protein
VGLQVRRADFAQWKVGFRQVSCLLVHSISVDLIFSVRRVSGGAFFVTVGLYVPLEFNRNSKSGDPVSLEGARLWFVDNGGDGDDDIVRTLYSKGS